MARIRTIKPEFFTSEQIADCSVQARLLFVGMWCFCDDGGVHPVSMKQLKMQVFPGDRLSLDDVRSLYDELLKADLIREFVAEDKRFFFVTGWHHQRIDKPNPRFPKPPDEVVSRSVIRTLQDQSPPDGKGLEGNGSGREGNSICPETPKPASSVPPVPPPAVEPALLEFPCDGKVQSWRLTVSQVAEWGQLFPSLDVLSECRSALAWVLASPERRKTARGMLKFLSGWLGRSQNRGGGAQSRAGPQRPNSASIDERRRAVLGDDPP